MSSQPFIQSHIKELLLFERLPDDQLALIAGAFQVLRFEPGALVFQQGTPGQGLFYFVSGRGILTRFAEETTAPGMTPREDMIGEVKENEFVGENSLFAQTIENASLRIVESSIVLFLARQRLTSLLIAHPELRTNLGLQRGDQHSTAKPLFKGQRTDEVVLQLFRRHWWSYARFLWIPLFLATVLLVGALLLTGSGLLAIGLGGIAFIIPGGVMYYLYVEWQDDALIITDQRVVRVENKWFGLQNSISEIPLDRIHEVNIVAPPADAFARTFNYATVTVRTAGGLGNLSLAMVTNTDRVRSLIFEHRERFRQSVAVQNRREIQAEVNKVLGLDTSDSPVGAGPQGGTSMTTTKSGGFSFSPLRMRFTNADGNTVFRKHWLVWLAHVFVPMLVIFGSLVFMIVSLVSPIPSIGGMGILVSLIGVPFGLLWFYLADWDWRNDQFILGDDRITFIRRRPLWLQNEVDQIRLEQVDSVISSIQGIIGNVFDKGSVNVSLVGSDIPKTLGSVFKPSEVQAEISQRQAQMRANAARADSQRQREAITEYLAAYHDRVVGADTDAKPTPHAAESSIPRDATPKLATQELEPPPPPIRDGVRPPRVPRMLPEE